MNKRLGKTQKLIIDHLKQNDGKAFFWVGMKAHWTQSVYSEEVEASIERLKDRRLVRGSFGGWVELTSRGKEL